MRTFQKRLTREEERIRHKLVFDAYKQRVSEDGGDIKNKAKFYQELADEFGYQKQSVKDLIVKLKKREELQTEN